MYVPRCVFFFNYNDSEINQSDSHGYIHIYSIYIYTCTHIYIYIYIYIYINKLTRYHGFITCLNQWEHLGWTAAHTALSQYITLQIYHFCRLEMLTQSCCMYQKFRAPARLVLTLYAYRTRAQLNRALAHLFQLSQGRLNELRPSAARSDHTSQTNRALGVKHARERLRLPSVSTLLFSRIPHTRVSTRPHSPIKCCPVPHSVALGPAGPAIVQVCTRKVHIMLWLRLWTLSITCFSIKHYKGILL